MINIPKGNTQINVTKTVFSALENTRGNNNYQKIIDIPCGKGEFTSFLADTYKDTTIIGIDRFSTPTTNNFSYFNSDALSFFEQEKPKDADVLISISGIMCFDGLDRLFSHFNQSLKSNGLLIITNDNFLTVRDRFNFLFFGHFKRFKLLYSKNEGNWNIVAPQGLVMHLKRNNFSNIKVKYTAIYTEDYLFIPFALILYPLFWLKLVLTKSEWSYKQKMEFFPFLSMIARHYVVSAIKN